MCWTKDFIGNKRIFKGVSVSKVTSDFRNENFFSSSFLISDSSHWSWFKFNIFVHVVVIEELFVAVGVGERKIGGKD